MAHQLCQSVQWYSSSHTVTEAMAQIVWAYIIEFCLLNILLDKIA